MADTLWPKWKAVGTSRTRRECPISRAPPFVPLDNSSYVGHSHPHWLQVPPALGLDDQDLDQTRTANTAAQPAASDAAEMRYASPRLRHAATLLFAQETKAEPATSEALAAASARLLDRLSHRLAQVIGPVGVQAIFLRAIKLREPEFAFLRKRIMAGERGDSIIELLLACLREQEPDVIQEVSVILFATFTGLLATVIGDRIAWNLLQQIWPDILLPEPELLEPHE